MEKDKGVVDGKKDPVEQVEIDPGVILELLRKAEADYRMKNPNSIPMPPKGRLSYPKM